jgi:hypothetical protein
LVIVIRLSLTESDDIKQLPLFKEETDFDIALIELEASAQLTSSIGIACLPKPNDAKLTFEDTKLLTR